MTNTQVVTGDKRLDRDLARLENRTSKRINAAAVRSGQAVVVRGIKSEAPRGPTGNLKRSVGARFRKKRKNGLYEAKVGVNVGKRVKQKTTRSGNVQKANAAPHAHLAILGTGNRSTKAGAGRGTMPGNNFVDRGFVKSQGAALSTIRQRLKQGIEKEASR